MRRQRGYSRPEKSSLLFEGVFFKHLFDVFIELCNTLVLIDFDRERCSGFNHNSLACFFGDDLSLAANAELYAHFLRKSECTAFVDIYEVFHTLSISYFQFYAKLRLV